LDFGVQFDKLTVRAVTEPVEVQSNDFGFWILDWLRLERTQLEIRQNFLMIPFEKGGLKPLFFRSDWSRKLLMCWDSWLQT
jgi:hypothetical protein